MVRATASLLALATALVGFDLAHAQSTPSGLLFQMSADHGLKADVAGGDPVPNFLDHVKSLPGGKLGAGYMQAADDGVAAWNAPGNIYAQRGTLSFFWRPRYPAGRNPFNIFRVGYADHTSWDMVWLRIDWNGHGYDAFVTDDNLARVRVSYRVDKVPAPDEWTHIAFSWDETKGVQLWINGELAARTMQTAVLDSGLDEFGFANRVMSPHQVQSRYNYLRGSDFDELRIYDRMLGAAEIAALSRGENPSPAIVPSRSLSEPSFAREWAWRYGWNRPDDIPVYLAAPQTRIRKVEFADAKDIKEWMYKATDGIAETTWPGVYNRSRLPGRHDYFELPDWNVYVDGGKTLTLTLPEEPFNHLELQGAAYGALTYRPPGAAGDIKLYDRPKDQERTFNQFATARTGGTLSFTNIAQETPIQEIAAYYITPGSAPEGVHRLTYTVRPDVAPDLPELQPLIRFIDGRYEPDERQTVMAVAPGAPTRVRTGKSAAPALPLVHILIPSNFSDSPAAIPLLRTYAYGWENMRDGLDGLEIKIPALNVKPTMGAYFPLNIQVKDPLWPERDLMDVTLSVKPGEARTVWLDTRDRILPNAPLYLTIAGSGADFDARQLSGLSVDLVFKDRTDALKEHIADRFNQVKDNWGFLVEEHTTSKRQRLYDRLFADITDLLRVDPDNEQGRYYWSEIMAGSQGWPSFTQPVPPAGEPLWAFRQLADLKLVKHFVDWWIDNRQSDYGDFGGGISDDTDLLEQWPGLALMGVEPEKITLSHDRLVAADYRNGMFTNGLPTIHADELHSYEEGINSNSENMYLNWGQPAAIERLMTTAAALPRIIARNPAGHMHFASNYFNGNDVVREDPWQWGKPYSYVILHPGLLMVDWNNQPATRSLLLALADGYLAHGKPGPDGTMVYPAEINWPNDAERGGVGIGEAISLFYAAWRWTGDDKYLRPIDAEVAKRGLGVLATVNGPMINLLNKREAWTPKILAATGGGKKRGDSFMRYLAWEATGDRSYLDQLFADEIQLNSQRMYMVTEGHWWSDRVELPSDILQRTRLGGVALKRNYEQPGNTVSWRFDQPDGAEKTAILLPNPKPDTFKVVAYNTSEAPVTGKMIGWDVAPGLWRVTTGEAADGGDQIQGAGVTHAQIFERTQSVSVNFAPHRTTVMTLERIKPSGDAPEDRPDIGLGADDVAWSKAGLRVTVHSLGSKPTPAGQVLVEAADGQVLAHASFPALAAPLDLKPKTTVATLPLSDELQKRAVRVRLTLNGEPAEITNSNNSTPLQGRPAEALGSR